MYKFYYLEDITQEDLNKLALERNILAKENQQLKKSIKLFTDDLANMTNRALQLEKQKDDVTQYIKNTYNNITKLGKRDLLRMLGERDE